MTIRKKSNTIKQLDNIRKGPLVFKDLLHLIRTTEKVKQAGALFVTKLIEEQLKEANLKLKIKVEVL